VIANLKAALEAILPANGYQTTVRAVYRGLVAPQAAPTPFICIATGRETYQELAWPNVNRRLPMTLVGELEVPEGAGDGAADEADRFLADMEKAVLANAKRGGYAVGTKLVSNVIFSDDPQEPWVEVQLDIEVEYRTTRTDPYTAV
jgi:hypothetical protein